MTLLDLNLSLDERAALEEVGAVLRQRYPVTDIILFGSKARGEGEPDSDLDLLILTLRPLEWAERKALLSDMYDVQMHFDVLLSPLLVAESEWTAGAYSVVPIFDEVQEHGVAV